MASRPIASWQIEGEMVEAVMDFLFLGSKITADGDCNHEIRRQLLLGRKAMANLDSMLKSRSIILPTKVHIVKSMAFPVVLYGCESWVIKKAEHQKIDAFKLWCWRRFLKVLWTSWRSKQSIWKEINPEYSLEGLMLKLQYFGYLMWTDDSLEKSLLLGKIEGKRRRGHQRMRWLDGHELGQTLGDGVGQGGLACCGFGVAGRQTWRDWTTTKDQWVGPSNLIVCVRMDLRKFISQGLYFSLK